MDFHMLAHLRDGSKFTGLARLMLYEIELHATSDTHRSFPSIALLAQHLGVTPRWAQQILRTLITAGAVQVIHGGGRGGTNTYQLPDLPERVNPSSGFPGKRVNSQRRKGEVSDTETLKPTSPEVVKEKERNERGETGLLTHGREKRPQQARCRFDGCSGPQCPHSFFCPSHYQCPECAQARELEANEIQELGG